MSKESNQLHQSELTQSSVSTTIGTSSAPITTTYVFPLSYPNITSHARTDSLELTTPPATTSSLSTTSVMETNQHPLLPEVTSTYSTLQTSGGVSHAPGNKMSQEKLSLQKSASLGSKGESGKDGNEGRIEFMQVPPPPLQSSTNPIAANFFSGVPSPLKLPHKSSLKKGHSRSASHGGVMGPQTFPITSDPNNPTPNVHPHPSTLRKGHTRAASHGTITDEDLSSTSVSITRGHSRTQSRTDFILPPGHTERGTISTTIPLPPPTHQYTKGHSRQASRSESIYTLRVDKKSKNNWLFWKRKVNEENTPRSRIILPNHVNRSTLTNSQYPNNQIRTTKYTAISFLPKNLFEQFHRFANLYFISIVLLNWIPAINAFGKEIAMLPVIFVLGVTAIKDLFEDRRRHQSDKRINNLLCRVYNSGLQRYVKAKWKQMRVGDFVHLSCNEMIPADILILRTSDPNGLCYIETMNLDGESNLKQREVIRDYVNKQSTFNPLDFVSEIQVGGPTTKIYHFGGYLLHPDGTRTPVTKENLLLRDCILKNTDFIEGIVIYAGRETKAMLNNGGPRHKRTGLERMMNLEVMWCVVILAILCIVGATGSSLWLVSLTDPSVPFAIHAKDPKDPDTDLSPIYEAFLSFLTYIIILQVMIPLSLYVTIEFTKLLQIYHIQNDAELFDKETGKGIECRAMNIPEDLGQIQYVFSDKTGTLTENKMLFRRCTIGLQDFSHLTEEGEEVNGQLPLLRVNPALSDVLGQLNIQLSVESGHVAVELTSYAKRVHDFFLVLAVCNTVVVAKYPHCDIMNASGLIMDESGCLDTNLAVARLSTICESGSGLSLFREKEESENLEDGNDCSRKRGINLQVHEQVRFGRRPGKLELPQIRPLSPISSSNETTPTDSPAAARHQRTRRIQIPHLPGARKMLDISNSSANRQPGTPTPSPAELRPIYEAESPDELALVEAAYAYQCKLLKRTPTHVRIIMPDEGLQEYEVLHTFPFDSVRKRMSVVLRHPTTQEIILYCKGADSAIFPNIRTIRSPTELEIVERTQRNINSYAREGLRILVMAKRILTLAEYRSWLPGHEDAESNIHNREALLTESYNRLEQELELVGATGIEDRLQDGVPEAIESLRRAGMVVWVLTGDKQETAVNIAYSCRLFSPKMDLIKINAKSKAAAGDTIAFYLDEIRRLANLSSPMDEMLRDGGNLHMNVMPIAPENASLGIGNERALVVDGKSLTYILDQRNSTLLLPFLNLTKQCSAVLCCRATPLQKAFIVTSVKDHLQMRTLAIGDGANDVSMIQRADVGIGISGKEGMQAVMASDFAISKFRFLERLLIVHGHWCYDRLARMILYFFYKNAAFVFVIFWYQLLNGWSGSVMIDQMYLMVFNLIFTALPPMAMGIYDQDASETTLLSVPRLYAAGRLRQTHTVHTFWWNMIDALYASVVIFFMAYGAYKDSDIGMIEFGTTITVSCMYTMLGNMAIESRSWTILHVISVVGSIIFFYAFALIYNSLCMDLLGIQTPCKVIQELMTTSTHWLVIFVTAVLAVIPRFVIRVILNSVEPSDVIRVHVAQRSLKKKSKKDSGEDGRNEFIASWSRSSSHSNVFQ